MYYLSKEFRRLIDSLKFIFVLGFALGLWTNANAQLSGTYTIGSGGNYTSITAAVTDLNTLGVNSAVTFNILSGTYDEQFEIGIINGVSASNTITFQSQTGNAADVIIQFIQVSGSNYIVRLNGTDYITFQNLTFTSLGSTTYCRMILIDDNSDNISILNNVFNSVATTSTSNPAAHIWCDPSTTTSDNLLVESNDFNNGGPGILFSGVNTGNLASGTQILNNTFSGVRRGIYMVYHDAPVIEGNVIDATGDYGIRTDYCDNALIISKNQVSVGSGYGIYLNYCDGGLPPTGTHGLMANNFVSMAANNSDGIYLNYSTYQDIYYNSVNARGGTGSNALVQNYGNNLNLVNNILVAPNGGRAYYINQPAAIGTSDYNNFYSPGNYLARWGSNDRRDLADLQMASSKDANSRSVFPHFASATDLHTVAPWLDGAGTVVPEVSDDIDGEPRGATPDIGADQFVPAAGTTTPLSGTYTIGSGGTYADFNTAASDLLLKGVSGPVTFEVLNGFYNEQVTFFEVAGASASDTVTFQSQSGNAADVTLFYPAGGANDNWIVRVYGADHLRFRNMTLQCNNAPGTTYGRIAYLVWGSRDLGFSGNIFTGFNTTSTSENLALIHGVDMLYDSLTVKGNSSTNGSVGVRLNGISNSVLTLGTRILNNTFSGIRRGIWLEYHDAPVIEGNVIDAPGDRGIVTSYCDNALIISKNQVSVGSGYGIYLNYCDGGLPPTGTHGLMANNFVSMAANNSDGIYLNYSTYQDIYYNSVNARGGTGSNALVQNYGNNLNLVNNILVAPNGGRAYYINQPAAIGTSDYNDFYTTGANLARWGGTDITDLAALQAASGKDVNSISADPLFVSNTNLHARAVEVDSAGTPLAEVIDDIDDEPRDATYPDIGADEFIFGFNYVPVITSQPDTTAKVDSLYDYQVVATDNNGDTLIYRFTQAPAFLTIDPDSGLIQGTPSLGDVGDHQVSIEVDDQHGGIANQTYTLHVEQANSIDPFANQIPDKFVIYQNYPNPFNPVTKIRFGVPVASQIRIEIYNALGQKVEELVNGYIAAGYHEVSFSASKYASGIYIYRMVAGNYQEIKKMMLIK